MSRRRILAYNPKLKDRAGDLRKNMTKAEVKLWVHIRKRQIAGLQFYRQRPIGNYIADFYCPEEKLVVEVDGGQHYETEGLRYDEEWDAYLRGLDLNVLRFSNLDVLSNICGVIEKIENIVAKEKVLCPPSKGDPQRS